MANYRRDPFEPNSNISHVIANRKAITESKSEIKLTKKQLKIKAENKAKQETKDRISAILERREANALEAY